MNAPRGKKKILKRAGQVPRRPGVNYMSNKPRPFGMDLPTAQVKIRKDGEGRIRTFNARTGEYQWISMIHAR